MGDHRPCIPPCVMASSAMGLNLGIFNFLPSTYAKMNAKQCVHYLHALCSILRMFYLLSQTAVDTVTSQLKNQDYFDYEKNPKTPI